MITRSEKQIPFSPLYILLRWKGRKSKNVGSEGGGRSFGSQPSRSRWDEWVHSSASAAPLPLRPHLPFGLWGPLCIFSNFLGSLRRECRGTLQIKVQHINVRRWSSSSSLQLGSVIQKMGKNFTSILWTSPVSAESEMIIAEAGVCLFCCVSRTGGQTHSQPVN